MLKRMQHKILFFVLSILFSACGQSNDSTSDISAIGSSHPLGGMRYIFVSQIDGRAWGVVCPGPVQNYFGLTPEEIVRCGYTSALGPVPVDNLLAAMPPSVDSYQLNLDLRAQPLITVASSRDQYYQLWETLERVADQSTGHLTPSSCLRVPCPRLPVSLSIDINGDNNTLYFYGTDEQGQFGSISIMADNSTRVINVNRREKALVNLFAGRTTIYLSREMMDKIIVNSAGGSVRYYYF